MEINCSMIYSSGDKYKRVTRKENHCAITINLTNLKTLDYELVPSHVTPFSYPVAIA